MIIDYSRRKKKIVKEKYTKSLLVFALFLAHFLATQRKFIDEEDRKGIKREVTNSSLKLY